MKKSKLAAIAVSLILLSLAAGLQVVEVAQAQISATVTINPDGSVTGTNNIQRKGDVYTLTGNISVGIQVQKSSIILDGAGYTITGNGIGTGVDFFSRTNACSNREHLHVLEHY